MTRKPHAIRVTARQFNNGKLFIGGGDEGEGLDLEGTVAVSSVGTDGTITANGIWTAGGLTGNYNLTGDCR